jgi:transcriptional regulator with XRE-family HTH domain
VPVTTAQIAAILTAERTKAGLRQEDLAKKIKRDQTWVARLEGGKRRIEISEFFMLAEAIGFDPIEALTKITLKKSKKKINCSLRLYMHFSPMPGARVRRCDALL